MPERGTRERDLPSVIPKPLRFELTRERLLTRLEGATDAKLIALVAPSGFGKTTLLAQYARTQGKRVIWLELREDDADTLTLAQSIRSAIERARGELKLPDSNGPDALARGLDDAAENLTLILDRVDRLGPDAGRWLEGFIATLAEGHRVIVAGYDADALSLARLVAEGSAAVIGADALAFDPGETERDLRDRGYAGEASAVHGALEGWPAGVALVAAGAAAQLEPTDLIADALSKLPLEVRSRLPEASVLEIWSEDAAAQLGCRLPAGWIQAVRRAGLPLTPLGRQAHRPLQVLLELLEAELRRDPLRHVALHRTAGIAAETSGDTLRAIQHYRTANLDDEAVRLAERVTPQLFARAEYQLICRTLERLPFAQLSAGAQESFGIALTETEQVTRGEVILRQLRAKDGLSASGLFTLGKLAMRAGEHARTLTLVDEGLGAAGGGTVDATRFLRLKGHALNELGRHAEALEVALEATRIAEARDDLKELGQAILLAQYAHYMLGHWAACERLIHRGIEVFEALGQPIRALMLYNDLANLQCIMGRTIEAGATLEYALPIAEREQNDVLRWLLETRADVHLWHGEFHQAADAYQAAVDSSASFSRVQTARFRLKLSEALWRDGRRDQAEARLAQASPDIPADLEHLRGRLAFVEGLMAFDRGQLEAAQDHLEKAARQSDDATQRPRAAGLLAEIARRAGQLEQAHVKRLMDALDAVPSDAVLNADGPHLTELWRACIAQGWFRERVAGFASLEPGSIAPSTAPIAAPTGPAQETVRLEIVTLGRLQVKLDAQAVRLPFAKAGEMLAWFALHGPSNHEQVIDALWDGSIESKHHEYFRVAVRRLRAALKGTKEARPDWNPLPFEDGVYALSEHLEIEIDTLSCERALETNDPADLQAALRSYRGEFLPGVDTEWVTQTRTRCLESAVAVALTLGAQLERTEPREALTAYRRAVELEPLGELGHLGLIRTHLALGGKAAANQAYTAYARMLLEEFGLEPSAELRRSLTDLGLRV